MLAGQLDAPWSVHDGLVLYDRKAYIHPSSPLLLAIVEAAHTTGHEGVQKTRMRLKADFHIPRMKQVVQDFIRSCQVCQQYKVEQLQPAGLLQPLEVPFHAWEHISMDFIEGLPHVNRKSVILTIVNRFSKYAHFVPLAHPYTAGSVARVFFDEVVQLHGFPCSISTTTTPSSPTTSGGSSSTSPASSST